MDSVAERKQALANPGSERREDYEPSGSGRRALQIREPGRDQERPPIIKARWNSSSGLL